MPTSKTKALSTGVVYKSNMLDVIETLQDFMTSVYRCIKSVVRKHIKRGKWKISSHLMDLSILTSTAEK